MDPNQNLKMQLKLAQEILQYDSTISTPLLLSHGEQLAELVLAMHKWIAEGGFLPIDWSHWTHAHT